MPDDKAVHWRQVIRRQNPEFLYAEDLGPPGTMFDVEITGAVPGKVKNPGSSKDVVVLTMAGARKKLGIGATGCKTMRKLTGTDDYRRWVGWITLVVIHTKYFDNTTQQDEETDAIRIAPDRPRGKQSSSQGGKADTAPAITPAEQAEIERKERGEQKQ